MAAEEQNVKGRRNMRQFAKPSFTPTAIFTVIYRGTYYPWIIHAVMYGTSSPQINYTARPNQTLRHIAPYGRRGIKRRGTPRPKWLTNPLKSGWGRLTERGRSKHCVWHVGFFSERETDIMPAIACQFSHKCPNKKHQTAGCGFYFKVLKVFWCDRRIQSARRCI